MIPHPQPEGKWELCEYHKDPDHSFDWELCRYPDAPFYNCETNREKFLCPFTCASHSSQQSEREKVLDEFKNWIIHDLVFCDIIGADHMFSHELILDKIESLRSSKGGEQG